MSEIAICSELLKEGRRQLFLGDLEGALQNLSQACRRMAAEKGDTADELFEPYLYYSKALYAYHKLSSDVIGGVVPEFNVEDENEREIMSTVLEENDLTSLNDIKSQESTADNEMDGEENKGDEENACNVEVNEKDEVKEDKNDDEDIGYLEMSYETIECAKLIIKRQLEEKILDEKSLECKLADCCDIAGDIYIEEEVNEEAIAQYETALKLRLKHLVSSDRLIAGSYYKIGVAYNIDYLSTDARMNFIKCRDILKINRDECVKKKEDTSELEDILAEIDEKLIECEENENEFKRAKESLREFMAAAQPSSKESSDISHLVRKRKNDDQSGEGSLNKQSKKEDE